MSEALGFNPQKGQRRGWPCPVCSGMWPGTASVSAKGTHLPVTAPLAGARVRLQRPAQLALAQEAPDSGLRAPGSGGQSPVTEPSGRDLLGDLGPGISPLGPLPSPGQRLLANIRRIKWTRGCPAHRGSRKRWETRGRDPGPQLQQHQHFLARQYLKGRFPT